MLVLFAGSCPADGQKTLVSKQEQARRPEANERTAEHDVSKHEVTGYIINGQALRGIPRTVINLQSTGLPEHILVSENIR